MESEGENKASSDVDVLKSPGDSATGSETVEELKSKIQNGGGDSMVNNVHQAEQNGHANLPNDIEKKHEKSESKHHSSSSSKHSSSSSKHKDGSSSKHRDGHHSSSKHSSSSSSSKHRDHSSSSSSKHKDGSSSSSSKHKDGSSSSSSKHKDGHSSSSSKHHSSSSGSKHSSSSSSKHKDGHSSSSSSKHHSSSSSKHSSSSSKHKDGHSSSSKHSSSDKHKSSSSSSKDGEKAKSSHSSDKHKSSSSSSSSKHRDRSPSKKTEEVEGKKEVTVKQEVQSPVKKEPQSPVKESARESPAKTPKEEPMSDDDVPLTARLQQEKAVKRPAESSDDDDDVPLSSRLEKVKKVKKEVDVKPKPDSAKKRKQLSDDEDDEDYEEKPKKKKKKVKTEKGSGKSASPSKTPNKTPTKGKGAKAEESNEVWRWWEEERRDDGVKWTFLEHKGPVFAPDYEPVPEDVRFYYDGKEMKLSQDTEEVATFYARMLEHDYTTKEVFNHNFMKDWRKVMNQHEKEKIKDLSKCNFKEMAEYFKQLSEERKNRTKEEKKKLKEENEAIQKEYGFCVMDGHKEKIGNFRIEPPGLFRGRGDHPKQGMLKRRTMPEDVIINCSKDSKAPKAPDGHKWKEVRNDNKVSWLACWTENIQGSTKYVMLNAASRLKGEKDWQKYETARRLHKTVDKIRAQYREDWKSKEMRIRQRAVALYFIDKLALRAGNEKEEGETADTVGCCSLRKEHLTLHEKYEDQENVVEFDFLGKDSIRYYNRVTVEKRVFKNLQLFMENKSGEDDVFDRLNTAILNKYLQELMEGLTAKVFRTYNASRTLQEQLNLLTEPEDPIPAKILSYNRANRAVAILCNHQRAAPKNFSKQMENLQVKIDDKKASIKEAKKLMKDAKSDYKNHKSEKTKSALEKRKKAVQRLEEQLTKLEVQATDKEENKEIALGTSKLNYLDPRISVAWCKKWEVPIEKIYNKTQREKFRWAIDMATAEFEF